MRYKPLLEVALIIRNDRHQGDPVKQDKHKTYIRDHLEPVVEGCRAVESKVLAALHDVVERAVEHSNQVRENAGTARLDRFEEEALIQNQIGGIIQRFKDYGHPEMNRNSPVMLDLDQITRRTFQNYKEYGERLIVDAKARGRHVTLVVKLSDLHNNSNPERNLRPQNQTAKRREKLVQNQDLGARIHAEFPKIDEELVLNVDGRGQERIRQEDRKQLKELGLSPGGRRFLRARKGAQPKHRLNYD